MSQKEIKNGPLGLNGKIISIFGERGFVEGKHWIMSLPYPEKTFVEVDPDPVSPEIEALLNQDIAEGKGGKIAHIQVSPQIAVRLYLEGRINDEHVRYALVIRNLAIIFSNVEFNTSGGGLCRFSVVVTLMGFPHAVTVDKDGLII